MPLYSHDLSNRQSALLNGTVVTLLIILLVDIFGTVNQSSVLSALAIGFGVAAGSFYIKRSTRYERFGE